jgi:lipid-binding SYLF domain-containing protein
MRRILLVAIILLPSIALAEDRSEISERLSNAGTVLTEIMSIPEKGIPRELLDKCTCVVVIPSMKKAGFVVGGNYGKGAISCRTKATGTWSGPSMVMIGGGSFGLQIGAQAVDLVLVVQNLSGLESLLDSKFTLGGDASVAAGPVGRTAAAETDAWMSAKILAYSRSRGLFGGLVLKGGVLRPDKDANQILYGKALRPRSILLDGAGGVPADAKPFVDELNRISPKKN